MPLLVDEGVTMNYAGDVNNILQENTATEMDDTKTRKLFAALSSSGRLRLSEAESIVGYGQLKNLVDCGALLKFRDDDPGYALGIPGKKPTCFYVEVGEPTERGATRHKAATSAGIQKAIAFLERNGYRVLPK